MIAIDPHLHRGEHTDNLFLADFHAAPVSMMRRARDPGRPDQIFAAQQKPGALRTPNRLSAASVKTGMFFFARL